LEPTSRASALPIEGNADGADRTDSRGSEDDENGSMIVRQSDFLNSKFSRLPFPRTCVRMARHVAHRNEVEGRRPRSEGQIPKHRTPTFSRLPTFLSTFSHSHFHRVSNRRGGTMQIISRRVNQGIVIGAETQITVLEIEQNSVELEIRSYTENQESRRVVRLYLEPEQADEPISDDSHRELPVLAGAR
jgi:carbon storage regulator CsrA